MSDTSPVEPVASLGRIGRFELRAALGQGGFGRVYRAYDPVLDREVALKVPRFAPDRPEQIARFLREAQASARLRHPNIVAVFETGQAGEDYYIATEFVEGEPLSMRIARGRVDRRQAAEWVRELARALAYAHGEGVIHRDVKPANIMIDRQGRAQLMDFGLAKRLGEEGPGPLGRGPGSEEAGLTQDGTVLGTPAYMAPEQASGELAKVGPHSDQYSLGVVLFELLAGEVPFRGSAAQVLAEVTSPVIEAPQFGDLGVKAPAALEAICRQALAKRPGARYRTASDFADDLDRFLRGAPVQAGRGVLHGLARSVAYWCRQHKVRLAATLLVVTALTAAWVVWRDARRSVADARAEVQRHQCDYLAEHGLRLCETKDPTRGVLFLARAFELADRSGDLDRQQQVGHDLARWMRQVPAVKGPRPAWDVVGERLLPDAERLEHVGSGRAIAVRPDGRPVALIRAQEFKVKIVLCDARTRKLLGPAVETNLESAVLAPDGRAVLAAKGQTWTVYDPMTGRVFGSKKEDGMDVKGFFDGERRYFFVRQLTLRDDLTSEDTAMHNAWVRPHRLDERGQIQALGPDIPLPRHLLGLSRDGAMLVTSRNNRFQFQDVESGEILRETSLPWGVGDIRGGTVGTEHLATCEGDGVRLWEWAGSGSGKEPSRPRAIGSLLSCPRARGARFSADGRLLLASGTEGTYVWDVTTRRLLGPPLRGGYSRQPDYRRPGGPIHSAALFGADNRSVLTVDNAEVRLWPVPPLVDDLPATVTLWVQVRTGMELEEDAPRALAVEDRQQRRGRLEKLLGL